MIELFVLHVESSSYRIRPSYKRRALQGVPEFPYPVFSVFRLDEIIYCMAEVIAGRTRQRVAGEKAPCCREFGDAVVENRVSDDQGGP